MPYIRPIRRHLLDVPLGRLIDSIDRDPLTMDGEVNYVICSLIDALYDHNYASLNRAIGVLECAQLEVYRRVLAPYEDTKIEANGDVFTERASNV